MTLWRLARAAYQQLDGEGARLYGGRWNSEGRAVVYLSTTLSLAAIEYLVHLEVDDVPSDLLAIEVDVPADASIEDVDLVSLPSDWRRVPDHAACVATGDRWLDAGASLLLRVPSAVVPRERNVLLNPAHDAAAAVRIVAAEPFSFDPRLLG